MADVPVLTGPRVTLRAPRLDDADVLFERIASDPEVPRYMSWRPHPDVGETRRVITEIFNVGGETTWLIELHDGGGPIGLCGWRRPQPHIIDFGYCLGRPWWRQGFMSEVAASASRKGPTRSDRVPGVRVLPCRQHRVGTGAGTQRASAGGPVGAVRHVSEHQLRAAGLPVVRQGAQITTPRTAHARPRSVKPASGASFTNRSRSLDCRACLSDSAKDAT